MPMLPEIPHSLYFALSAVLFTIGAIGVITRRNAIIVFMCLELMLNGVNLAFIAAGNALQSLDGVIFVFFVMTVAAAEAAVGLAIFVMIFRLKGSVNVDQINLLKG
jgi:NADH-quinone oxidoreductase subunit K